MTKLQALAGAPPWSDRQWAPVDFGPGAAVRAEDNGAPTAVVFPTEPGPRSLGEALVWADRHRIGHLHLLIDPSAASPGRDDPSVQVSSDAEDPEGSPSSGGAEPADDLATVLARRAAWFATPDITVHRLVIPAGQRPRPEPVAPRELFLPPAADLDHPLVKVMVDANVEIVVEGGIVRGEVNGLEVARVVPVADLLFPGVDPEVAPDGRPASSGSNVVDGYRLDVGVGQADRELTAYVHAGAEPAAEVARVRDAVREWRRAGAAPHPLNQLVPERWLRAAAIRHPERLGLAGLRPVRRIPARIGMTETAVAAAQGSTLDDGRPVVAVFSVGMDIDLVSAAAEMRAYAIAGAAGSPVNGVPPSASGPADGTDGRTLTAASSGTPALWLVVPERDAHPVVHRLAAALRDPAVVVPVPADWRTW